MRDPDDDIEDFESDECDCGVVEHTIEEVDWNRCGCCGKPIET